MWCLFGLGIPVGWRDIHFDDCRLLGCCWFALGFVVGWWICGVCFCLLAVWIGISADMSRGLPGLVGLWALVFELFLDGLLGLVVVC